MSDPTIEHTHSLWEPFSQEHIPVWELQVRRAGEEGSVSTTCAPAMFTKMEMVGCSKAETAAGRFGYKDMLLEQ